MMILAMRFYQDDIAIVACAGIFPDADDENQFFSQLLEGHCSIKNLADSHDTNHLQIQYHFAADKKAKDSSYSRYATQISLDRISQWARKNDLFDSEMSSIEVIMHELISRMANSQSDLFANQKSECVIAMGTGEPYAVRLMQKKVYEEIMSRVELNAIERARIDQYLRNIENHPPRNSYLDKDLFFPLTYQSLRQKYGFNGPCSFIDAACASSLAALMVAINRLRSGACDVVVSGGVDIGLGVVTLIAFSKVQVLSDEIMNPFDITGDGMNQGEAAALFTLMRLSDAKKQGRSILGVIRNCEGSSDGIQGGIVEPTERGQVLAYERAYNDVPMQPLDFLECHGTGTVVGDRTEKLSTAKYFHPLPPIGSVKANVGHTVCAAGAVSLVKALKIIENKIIPGMPRLKQVAKDTLHRIPQKNLPISHQENVRIGVSSLALVGLIIIWSSTNIKAKKC